VISSNFRRALALIFVLAFAGTACSGSPTDAARVNGTAISQSDLSDEIDALITAVKNAPDDKMSAEQRVSVLNQLTVGSKATTPSAQASASLLTNRIFAVLVSEALDRFGLQIEAEDTAASTQDIDENSIYGLASAKWREHAIQDGARTSRLSRYLEDPANVWYTDADVDAYFAAKKATFTQACTSHILVDDRVTADKLLAELKAGGDFVKAAAANSTDTSNKDKGGELGCNPKGAFVPAFEAAISKAKDGELVGPVETEFGFHIIKVTSTYKARELDDALRQEIRQTLGTPIGWLDLTLANAKITVNSKYGTWSATDRSVVPPAGAATPSTAPVAEPELPTGATGK
jgi:parvulin-like peptidyl-prolyl isomerase